MKRDLTIAFSVYGQPKMLDYWLEQFLKNPQEVRDRVEVIVVDDCGEPPAVVPKMPGIRLFRVATDIHWNQGGCRNLAAEQATTDRLMLIDPDMTLPDGMLQLLLDEAVLLTPGVCFRPALRHMSTKAFDHTSPNVHLLLRQDFLARGGYDEDYCGNKGWSDVQMLRIFERSMVLRKREDLWFWFHHSNKSLEDAQVTKLNRSVKKNKILHIKKMGLLRRVGWKAFVKTAIGRRIRFKWSELT